MTNSQPTTKFNLADLDDKDQLLKLITSSLAEHNISWAEHMMLEKVHAQNIAIGLTDDEQKIMAGAETYEECALKIEVLGDHTKQRKERYDKIARLLTMNYRPEMISKIGSWLDVTPDNYDAVKDELLFVSSGLTVTRC